MGIEQGTVSQPWDVAVFQGRTQPALLGPIPLSSPPRRLTSLLLPSPPFYHPFLFFLTARN